MLWASRLPTIAWVEPLWLIRKADCQVTLVPSIRSRAGSFMVSLSLTKVSQRSISFSCKIRAAWVIFSLSSDFMTTSQWKALLEYIVYKLASCPHAI